MLADTGSPPGLLDAVRHRYSSRTATGGASPTTIPWCRIHTRQLLLVLPRNPRGYWGAVTNGKTGFARLTLPALAALTPPGWDVEILDARVAEPDYLRPVDLVGITAFTAEAPSAYAMADGFRRRGVPVVIGGVHASARPEEALLHADAVVIGEADEVWATLLADAAAGRLQRVYRADRYCDLRSVPVPRRDLLDRRLYVSGFNTVQATRGCPRDCAYCAVTGVFGRSFRTRPVADVIAEIRGLDTREFLFVDDNICGNPAYARELFQALVPLGRAWGGQTDITLARDDEMLRLYARAGGRYAFIGFESLSETNLAAINKQWGNLRAYGEAIRTLHAAGINILGSFIFGLDDDDPGIFRRTLDFVTAHRIDAVQYHILTPFPGTRLYDAMEAAGRITERDWSRYHTSEVVFTPRGMTAKELQEGFYRVCRESYTWRRIIRRTMRSPRGMLLRLAMNINYRHKAGRMPDPDRPGAAGRSGLGLPLAAPCPGEK